MMSLAMPFSLLGWIEDNRELLKPPVCNREMYPHSDFIVQVVGGPNSRTDYHYDVGPELFYQIEGDMLLKTVQDGRIVDVPIREGEIFLLPPCVPHSPQRFENTVGIVVERQRTPEEEDGFMWFCAECNHKLHEEFLHVADIVTDLPPVFERFYGNEDARTCDRCGAVMPADQAPRHADATPVRRHAHSPEPMASTEFSTDLSYATKLDAEDELAGFRRRFHQPGAGQARAVYLCGHSLGLMPRSARTLVNTELDRWAERAVEGHFGADGWLGYHERFSEPLAALIGAHPGEVVAMNTLTANLHLMLVSFFRPGRERRKIVIERGAFPSDRYAVQSQLGFHGLDPANSMLELTPAPDTGLLDPEGLERLLETEGERVALVLLPGVQFLTGQALDLRTYTDIAHRFGCRVGFDLAHAIGNLPLAVRDSGADFAVWCSYKYLNGGPGAVAGCFVHERWAEAGDLPRFAGWWGHDKQSRFRLAPEFSAIPGAEGWQLSNPPVLSLAPLAASLDIFAEAGMDRLRRKSERLTAYLEYLLQSMLAERIEILTPRGAADRGCQLSVRLRDPTASMDAIQQHLQRSGVIADWRPPDIVRLAPVPLYNRYRDAFEAVRALERALA